MEWEQAKKVAALERRAADALASDARRDQERTRAKKNAASQGQDHAVRRSARKAAEAASQRVQELERRVAGLRDELANPALYDGTAANAKRAGTLDKQLTDAQRQLDTAVAKWAEAEDAVG